MKIIKFLPLIVVMFSFISAYGQQFPTGGYQGGSHGNIKVKLWAGTTDDNWSEPGNWCPAVVPGEEDDVVIPSGASVMPEVKEEGLKCKSLTLEPEATVTIKPGYTLVVNGRKLE